jgi:hypothetical protein
MLALVHAALWAQRRYFNNVQRIAPEHL